MGDDATRKKGVHVWFVVPFRGLASVHQELSAVRVGSGFMGGRARLRWELNPLCSRWMIILSPWPYVSQLTFAKKNLCKISEAWINQ